MNAETTSPSAFSIDVTEYSLQHYQLNRIVSDIKLHLYHLPCDSALFPWPANPGIPQLDIQKRLLIWQERRAERSFNFDHRQSHIWRMKLDIQFHTAMILLFQPSQVIRSPSEESLKTCFDNALSILDNYQLLHDLRGLHFDWKAVQNIFAAGATLIYSFWTSNLVRSTASTSDTSRSLRACSNLLAIGGEWWPSAKIGQRSLNLVVDLTMRKLYMQDVASKHPRLATSLDSTDDPKDGVGDVEPYQPLLTSMPSHSPASIPEGGNIGSCHPEPITNCPILNVHNMNDLDKNDSSQALDSVDVEVASEIESFLVDFNKSDFNWSLSLDSARCDNEESLHLDFDF